MVFQKINLQDLTRSKRFNEIETILDKFPGVATDVDENKRFLLHWAALLGQTRLAELLSSAHPNQINSLDDLCASPLILATLGGHFQIVKMLVEKGAKINQRNSQGHSSLQYACSRERVNIVSFLLEHGVDVNITDNLGDTPLHRLASSNGSIEILRLLLEHKPQPSINQLNKQGLTALQIALQENHNTEFIDELKKAGALLEVQG